MIFRIKRSDRVRARNIIANTAAEAIRQACGADYYSARQDSWAEDGRSSMWRVTFSVGRKDKTGGQPVVERTVYVESL